MSDSGKEDFLYSKLCKLASVQSFVILVIKKSVKFKFVSKLYIHKSIQIKLN